MNLTKFLLIILRAGTALPSPLPEISLFGPPETGDNRVLQSSVVQ